MSEIIACPRCAKKLRVAEPRPGYTLQVRCPSCDQEFERPDQTENLPAVRSGRESSRETENVPAVRRSEESAPAPREGARSALNTIGEKLGALTRPGWFKTPHNMGEVVPRMDTTPRVAEIFLLGMVCSHTKRHFTQTFAKMNLGEPFRLVDNEESGSYLRLARESGCRISESTPKVSSLDDFDWSNWQCQQCRCGRIVGDPTDYFQCGYPDCLALNCSRSIIYPRSAAATALCGACGRSSILVDGLQTVSGKRHLSRRE
jgi:hypothetical protein